MIRVLLVIIIVVLLVGGVVGYGYAGAYGDTLEAVIGAAIVVTAIFLALDLRRR